MLIKKHQNIAYFNQAIPSLNKQAIKVGDQGFELVPSGQIITIEQIRKAEEKGALNWIDNEVATAILGNPSFNIHTTSDISPESMVVKDKAINLILFIKNIFLSPTKKYYAFGIVGVLCLIAISGVGYFALKEKPQIPKPVETASDSETTTTPRPNPTTTTTPSITPTVVIDSVKPLPGIIRDESQNTTLTISGYILESSIATSSVSSTPTAPPSGVLLIHGSDNRIHPMFYTPDTVFIINNTKSSVNEFVRTASIVNNTPTRVSSFFVIPRPQESVITTETVPGNLSPTAVGLKLIEAKAP